MMARSGASCTLDSLFRRVVQSASLTVVFAHLFALSLAAQSASLAGTVRADGTERPLANAEISIPQLKRSVRSDSAGNFELAAIPAGTHRVLIRLLGYASYDGNVQIKPAQKLEIDIVLQPSATKIATVVVLDSANTRWRMRLADFEERRHSGASGRFLTADVFEKSQGSILSDVFLGHFPGIKRINLKNASVKPLASARGATLKGVCYLPIIVNGLVMYNSSPGLDFYDLDLINTADVIGVEFYSVASTPARYRMTGSDCGTLVIWTKG